MAIANARTGYHNGSTSGWAARALWQVGGNLYAIVLDTASSPTKVRCYKSTDNGATWTEQDSSHAPSHYSATVSYDAAMALSTITDKIYVAYRPTLTDNREVAIRRFDTTTGLWETATIGGIAGNRGHPDYNVRIAIRPDGDITLWYLYSGNIQVQYWTWRGASWAGPTAFSGSDQFWPLDAVQTTDSDRAVLAYTRSTLQYMVRTIDSADAVGNETTVDTSVSLLFASVYGYINDAGTHRIAGLVRDSDGTGDVAAFLSATNPTISIVNDVIPATTTDMGIMGGAVVAYGGKWHAIWSGDGRGAIHMTSSDDYATPVFGANTDVITGLGTDPALSAIATADGVAVLYTDPTGPSVDLIWAVDGPSSSTPVNSSDTGTLSGAGASTLVATVPVSDTGTISGSATSSVAASIPGSDTGTVSATGVSAVQAAIAATDTGTVSATGASTIGAAVASADTGTIAAADLSTVDDVTGSIPVSATDTATIAASETATVRAAIPGADTGTLSGVGISTIAAHLTSADTGVIAASESAAVIATGSSAETGTIGATETSAVTVAVATVDTLTLLIVEATTAANVDLTAYGVFAATPTIVDRFAGTPTIIDRWAGTPDIA